jgi:hypothetical protein
MLWRRRLEREDFGEIVGEVEDFVGVRVDAALRLEKDPLFRMDGFMGDDCIAPIRRFVMDAVRD